MTIPSCAALCLAFNLGLSAAAAGVEALRAAYAGRVTLDNFDKAHASSAAMLALLAGWPPLGKPVDDLARITGTAGGTDGDDRVYRFDTGFGGTEFRFTVEKGIITAVHLTPME